MSSSSIADGRAATVRLDRAISVPGLLCFIARVLPGLLLCLGVTLIAYGADSVEAVLLGRDWLEALVLAILVGTAIRTAWTPGQHWLPGITFSAKALLEIAVVLLGASVSARTVLVAGPYLLLGIAGTVLVAIGASYGLGRLLGLPYRMALLVACGNSICGNSAIAAVAPVIGADGEDIAASIAFTAVLGVLVVLLLPFAVPLLHLSGMQYGVLAGLTVYAVPQVLAAAAPIGSAAIAMGTLVKLARVLMLGPIVLGLSLLTRRLRDEPDEPMPHVTAGDRPKPGRLPLRKMVPWFIIGFVGLAALRSGSLLPGPALAPIAMVANLLTVVSMAALGLGTDLKVVARAGIRVTLAVTLSLLILGVISLLLIRFLTLAELPLSASLAPGDRAPINPRQRLGRGFHRKIPVRGFQTLFHTAGDLFRCLRCPNEDFLPRLPAFRRRNTLSGACAKRLHQAKNFRHVPPVRHRVVDHGFQDSGRIDHEGGTNSGGVRGARMDHAIGVSHLHGQIFDDRKWNLNPEFPLDIFDPSEVRKDAVDGKTEQFTFERLELFRRFGEADELGGADRREVSGVGKQDEPTAFIVRERPWPMGGIGLECRSGLVDAREARNGRVLRARCGKDWLGRHSGIGRFFLGLHIRTAH